MLNSKYLVNYKYKWCLSSSHTKLDQVWNSDTLIQINFCRPSCLMLLFMLALLHISVLIEQKYSVKSGDGLFAPPPSELRI